MAKQTQSPCNTWRWKSLLWHVLHYELRMINQRESILLQFSLPLVTTEFTDTKSVSREPGGYKCKTAIWDIHNLCAFDVVICKKLQRNFNGLEAENGEKNLWGGCLAIFFCSKSLLHQRKIKSFWNLNSAIEPVITEKRRISSSYFNALLICWLGSHKLLRSGRQHCPIWSTKKSYFHWSMSFCTKQIKIDNTLQQNPAVN